jgi:hypothetical protein
MRTAISAADRADRRWGARFAVRGGVARLKRFTRDSVTRIIVSGRLSAGDMGRLEQLCAAVLTERRLPLELDLRDVTEVDRTAAAVIRRLRDRGAQVVGANWLDAGTVE